MNYLELKAMRKKYTDNAANICLALSFFYMMAIVVITLIVSISNPVLASGLAIIVSTVIFILMTLVALCAIRMALYLTDEMKKAWVKETGIPY